MVCGFECWSLGMGWRAVELGREGLLDWIDGGKWPALGRMGGLGVGWFEDRLCRRGGG